MIVRAMPDELRLVEEYLGVTHNSVNRQVILEAKVLEVELKDAYQTGINWAALGANSTFGQVGGGTIFNSGISEIGGNIGNINPGTPFSAISGTNASAFGGVFSLAVKTADFAAFLELLKTQGNVHVLSSPRVSTINNQKAVIKVGGDEFFVTSVTGGTAAVIGVSAATAPTVVLTPFFSGIALDVTPQIDEYNNIILHIHPAVSEVVQRNKAFIVGSDSFNLPLASSTIQESDNIVRAFNGQIVVIGGLMKEGATDQMRASVARRYRFWATPSNTSASRQARTRDHAQATVVDAAQVWEHHPGFAGTHPEAQALIWLFFQAPLKSIAPITAPDWLMDFVQACFPRDERPCTRSTTVFSSSRSITPTRIFSSPTVPGKR